MSRYLSMNRITVKMPDSFRRTFSGSIAYGTRRSDKNLSDRVDGEPTRGPVFMTLSILTPSDTQLLSSHTVFTLS